MSRSIFILLFMLLSLYEAGNLTGFSWTRLKYVSQQEIINAAVRRSYPDIYFNLQEMQVDYSKFKPEVRYWGSWSWEDENGLLGKLFGFKRYHVRMPEEIVVVGVDGRAIYSYGHSDITPPDNPEQGIVGTVQYGNPGYEVVKDFSVQWDGNDKGEVFTSGHCFSAYISTPTNKILMVSPKDAKPIAIRLGFGFYLVNITSDERSSVGSIRISRDVFLASRSCSKEAREAWPNVGGWAWKR